MSPKAVLNRCGKSRPTGIRSPDRPARSELLYRLSYTGPRFLLCSGAWNFEVAYKFSENL